MAPTKALNSSSTGASGGPDDDEDVGEAASEGDETIEDEFESKDGEEAAAAEARSDEDVEASEWRLEGCFNSGHSSGSR